MGMKVIESQSITLNLHCSQLYIIMLKCSYWQPPQYRHAGLARLVTEPNAKLVCWEPTKKINTSFKSQKSLQYKLTHYALTSLRRAKAHKLKAFILSPFLEQKHPRNERTPRRWSSHFCFWIQILVTCISRERTWLPPRLQIASHKCKHSQCKCATANS